MYSLFCIVMPPMIFSGSEVENHERKQPSPMTYPRLGYTEIYSHAICTTRPLHFTCICRAGHSPQRPRQLPLQRAYQPDNCCFVIPFRSTNTLPRCCIVIVAKHWPHAQLCLCIYKGLIYLVPHGFHLPSGSVVPHD